VKVYVVLSPTYCGYDDYVIEGIFKSKENAEKCANDNGYCKVEEWEVEE
jgi:hypothetical protein